MTYDGYPLIDTWILKIEVDCLALKPWILNFELRTPNSELQTLNPELWTLSIPFLYNIETYR